MSTRSIIAEPTATGWQGRYCHWDGYPQAKETELFLLVTRDGIDKVRKTIIHDHLSWSCLDLDKSELGPHDSDGRFKLVEGYGVAHLDMEPGEGLFTDKDSDFGWAEYLYILKDDCLEMYDMAGELLGTREWLPPLVVA
jgi:hypothetical protein